MLIIVIEELKDDPWKLLIAVSLLNVTSGKVAIPIFKILVQRWPTPRDLRNGKYQVSFLDLS